VDASLIQSLFNFITNNIFTVIFLFAAVEVYMVAAIFMLLKKHENILADVCQNLVKGFYDAPDHDSSRSIHEKIESVIEFIKIKIADEPEKKSEFSKNARSINRQSFYSRHYKIEIYASVMSTLVQVFPLLGILGTILAIAQTAFQSGGKIDVSSLSNAFVLAMDTTILGISLSILFMVIESTFQPKIERIIQESNEYKEIVSRIQIS
jgi:biopolymer transport protein ExbB/TolQ